MKVLIVCKKHIALIFTSLFVVISSIILFKHSSNSVLVNATPITNRIVILDAGHGMPDNGTSGLDGSTEQKINLEITLKLQNIIEQSGAKVILTRSDENGIYELDKNSIRAKKVSDMAKRVDIGNGSNADIYVSIHLNYFEQTKYNGWQTFYQSNNANSKALANFVQNALNDNIGISKKREIMAIKGAYIMDNVKIPAVIVECGFLSNIEERERLKTDEYQAHIAWSIYAGIQGYFGGIT